MFRASDVYSRTQRYSYGRERVFVRRVWRMPADPLFSSVLTLHFIPSSSSRARSWSWRGGYHFRRGPAAELPTAGGQEDLATKACRGQPMLRPQLPGEWEVGGGAGEVVSLNGRQSGNSRASSLLRSAFLPFYGESSARRDVRVGCKVWCRDFMPDLAQGGDAHQPIRV